MCVCTLEFGAHLYGQYCASILLTVFLSLSTGKHGCVAEACADLGQYVIEECPHLKLTGLMTIGRQYQSISPNPDFMVCVCVNICMC